MGPAFTNHRVRYTVRSNIIVFQHLRHIIIIVFQARLDRIYRSAFQRRRMAWNRRALFAWMAWILLAGIAWILLARKAGIRRALYAWMAWIILARMAWIRAWAHELVKISESRNG